MILGKNKIKEIFGLRLRINFLNPFDLAFKICQFLSWIFVLHAINNLNAQGNANAINWPSYINTLQEFRNDGSNEEWVNLGSDFPLGLRR